MSKSKPLPAFPTQDQCGNPLMREVSFVLAGVNHVHDGSDPQQVITQNLRGEWLELQADPNNKHDGIAVKVLYQGQYIGWLPISNITLEQFGARKTIFSRLCQGHTVLARFDDITNVQIGGWDLDDLDPRIDQYTFNSAEITCAFYQLPRKSTRPVQSAPKIDIVGSHVEEQQLVAADPASPTCLSESKREILPRDKQLKMLFPLSIILVIMSILLLLAEPVWGIVGIALGVCGIIKSKPKK